MADEQHRVSWEARAAYLSALRDLRIAVDREMDLAQVGGETPTRLPSAIRDVIEARNGYRDACTATKISPPPPSLRAKH